MREKHKTRKLKSGRETGDERPGLRGQAGRQQEEGWASTRAKLAKAPDRLGDLHKTILNMEDIPQHPGSGATFGQNSNLFYFGVACLF